MVSESKTHGVYLAGAGVPPLSQFVSGAHIVTVWPSNEYHQMACRLEDLGWEVRDCIKAYLFGVSYQIGFFRKPFKGTALANVLKHGAGVINIEANRVGSFVQDTSKNARKASSHQATIYRSGLKEHFEGRITEGRWPANLILDAESSAEMDRQMPVAGNLFNAERSVSTSGGTGNSWTNGGKAVGESNGFYDAPSGASKFFAKVSNLTELNDLLTSLIEPPSHDDKEVSQEN